MSPPLAAAAIAALELMKAEPERVARLRAERRRSSCAARKTPGIDTGTSHGTPSSPSSSAISSTPARLADRMLARGVNVLPIIYPAVPRTAARLRFFITSEHTPEQIREAVRIMREEMDGLGKRQKQAA